MSCFDEARALSQIIAMRKMTQSELAKSMGVSQSYIANKLRLLRFSGRMELLIRSKGLSERHARALLRLPTESDMEDAVEKITAMRLNVHESEVLIDSMLPKKEMRRDYALKTLPDIREELERDISSALAAMRRLGADASKTVSTYGKKRYITLCIKE